jgi:hypothetical protein
VVPNQLNAFADGFDTDCNDESYKMMAPRLQMIWADCHFFPIKSGHGSLSVVVWPPAGINSFPST